MMAFVNDYELKEEFEIAADALDESLKPLRAPMEGDPAEDFDKQATYEFSAKVMMRAFDFYRGQVPLSDDQMKNLIPEIRGARMIVDALVAEGVRFQLPIMSQIVVYFSRIKRRLKGCVIPSRPSK